ncbi:hypothetical protein [Dysgonomonas termitidis]|uniref:DUF4988 domain-containing protein n=1 Tax=Dysgonomonas termitidis TaxID=1516126 RepID=A0ABV9KTF8_9BACT
MIRPLETLKSWFTTGSYPTQEQFWDWMDSFFHKSDGVDINNINGLNQYINDRNQSLTETMQDEEAAREQADADLLAQIQYNSARIAELQGTGGALPHNDFGQLGSPLTNADKQTLTVYAISYIWPGYTDLVYNAADPAASTFKDANGGDHTAAEIFNSTWVRNDFDNHRLVLANTQDTEPAVFDWADVGADVVDIATQLLAGIVLGTEDQEANKGYVNVLANGQMKVIGWDALINSLSAMTTRYAFESASQNVATLAGIPVANGGNVNATLAAASTLSVTGVIPTGAEMCIRAYNGSAAAITVTLPATGDVYVNDYGNVSVSIPAGKAVEINLWCYTAGKYSIRVGEPN